MVVQSSQPQHWKVLYRAATLESDPKLLRHLLDQAQRAIQSREKQLRKGGRSISAHESEQLDAAMSYLMSLSALVQQMQTGAASTPRKVA